MHISILTNLTSNQKIALIGLGSENLQFLKWLVEVVKIEPKKIIITDQKEPNFQTWQDLEKWQIQKKNVIIGPNYLEILNPNSTLNSKNNQKIENLETENSKNKVEMETKIKMETRSWNLEMNTEMRNSKQNLGDKLDENLNNNSNFFDQIEYVFKSPGIASLKSEFVFFRQIKGENRVLSPLCFFVNKFREQIIGVTGTKGKTTTSSLIEHFLRNKLAFLGQRELELAKNLEKILNSSTNSSIGFKNSKEENFQANFISGKTNSQNPNSQNPNSQSSNKENQNKENLQITNYKPKVHYCGNTSGISPYKFWTSLEQNVDLEEFFIVELSSFQLQDLGFSGLSPKFAVISNYFVDHLDQHDNKFEYWKAKSQIFLHQKSGDFLVSNEQFLEQIEYIGDQIYSELGNYKVTEYDFEEPKNREFIIIKEVAEFLKKFYTTSLLGEHNWQNLLNALFVSEIVCEVFKRRKAKKSQNEKSKVENLPISKSSNLEKNLETSSSEIKILENNFANNLENKIQNLIESVTEKLSDSKQITLYDILQNLIRHNQIENQQIINTFQTVKHRLELIKTVQIETKKENFINPENNNSQKSLESLKDSKLIISNLTIKFWDDGAATEPESVIAAVKALSQNSNEFLWLLMTGKDKNGNWSEFVQTIFENHNSIFRFDCFGQVAAGFVSDLAKFREKPQKENFNQFWFEDIFSVISKEPEFKNFVTNLNFEKHFGKFFDCFLPINSKYQNLIRNSNNSKDLILNIVLSPGGSSFDEFANYKERSEFWRQKVEKATQEFNQI